MATPFPGMDPYLEDPTIWPDVHNRLIAALGNELGPVLRPRYVVTLEERVYATVPEGLQFLGRPDATIVRETPEGGSGYDSGSGAVVLEVEVPHRVRETHLVVRQVGNHEIVTILELLSPTNKHPGGGRPLYERKRDEILDSRAHFVEIDLIRAGEPMSVSHRPERFDYSILVSRANRRPSGTLTSFTVKDAIPTFQLPLLAGDDEPVVDLGATLHALYDLAAYDLRIDYRRPCEPPLHDDSTNWCDALLRAKNLR